MAAAAFRGSAVSDPRATNTTVTSSSSPTNTGATPAYAKPFPNAR